MSKLEGIAPQPRYIEHIQFEGRDCVVLSPEEYEALWEVASQSEAVERDAARYRWLRDHDMTEEYQEYHSANLNGRGVDPLDATIDAAMRSGVSEQRPTERSDK